MPIMDAERLKLSLEQQKTDIRSFVDGSAEAGVGKGVALGELAFFPLAIPSLLKGAKTGVTYIGKKYDDLKSDIALLGEDAGSAFFGTAPSIDNAAGVGANVTKFGNIPTDVQISLGKNATRPADKNINKLYNDLLSGKINLDTQPYGYQINVGGKLNPLFDKNSYVYTTPFKEMTKNQKHSMQYSKHQNYKMFGCSDMQTSGNIIVAILF